MKENNFVPLDRFTDTLNEGQAHDFGYSQSHSFINTSFVRWFTFYVNYQSSGMKCESSLISESSITSVIFRSHVVFYIMANDKLWQLIASILYPHIPSALRLLLLSWGSIWIWFSYSWQHRRMVLPLRSE